MNFFLYASQGVMPTILPQVQRDFGVSMSQVSLLNSAFALTRMLAAGTAGYWIARVGARSVSLVAVSAMLGGALLSAAARSIGVAVLGRAIVGAGFSLMIVASLTVLITAWPASCHGRILNTYELAVASSMAVWGLVTGSIMQVVGWRGVFFGSAGCSALAGIAALLVFRKGEGRGEVAETKTRVEQPGDTRGTLLWPVGITFFLALCLALFVAGFFLTLFPLYGAFILGASPWAVGSAISAGFVVNVLTLLPLGWLCDRYRRPYLLAGAFGLLGVVLLGFLSPISALRYKGSALLIGLGMSAWWIPAMILAESTPSASRTVLLGWYRGASDVGVVLGPILLTALAQRASYPVAIGALATLMLGAALVAMVFGVLQSDLVRVGSGGRV